MTNKNRKQGKYNIFHGLIFIHWTVNDVTHREDGPAKVWHNGDDEWYLDDQSYTEENWKKDPRVIKAMRLAKLKALGI